jgi:FkbM family methyltransferase
MHTLKRQIGKLIRSNRFINFLVRNMIRTFIRLGGKANRLSLKFRAYGVIPLTIENTNILTRTYADDLIANVLYYETEPRDTIFVFLKKLSHELNWFVEVGSFTAIYSIFAAHINSKLKIISVEPHPKNHDRIIQNVALNHVSNVKVLNVAMGSADGTIEFTIPKNEPLSTTGSVNENFAKGIMELEHRKFSVETMTLDSLCKQEGISGVTFIKIDVEYYELEVLRGSLLTLQSLKPILLVEIILYERLVYYKPELKNTLDEHHVREIESLLFSLGYFPYLILIDGIYRIDSVFNNPDNRDFLFLPFSTEGRFTAFENVSTLIKNRW